MIMCLGGLFTWWLRLTMLERVCDMTVSQRGPNTVLDCFRKVFRNIPRRLKTLHEFKLGISKFPLGAEGGVANRLVRVNFMQQSMKVR